MKTVKCPDCGLNIFIESDRDIKIKRCMFCEEKLLDEGKSVREDPRPPCADEDEFQPGLFDSGRCTGRSS